jgi:hypothetical protein
MIVNMRQRSDTDIMIEALEEATLRADPSVTSKRDWSAPRELAIIADLIEAKCIRGDVLYHQDGVTPRGVAMGGATLAGRIYRDTLKKQRDEKKLLSRLRRQSWAIGGWLAGVATVIIGAGAKALLEWFLK